MAPNVTIFLLLSVAAVAAAATANPPAPASAPSFSHPLRGHHGAQVGHHGLRSGHHRRREAPTPTFAPTIAPAVAPLTTEKQDSVDLLGIAKSLEDAVKSSPDSVKNIEGVLAGSSSESIDKVKEALAPAAKDPATITEVIDKVEGSIPPSAKGTAASIPDLIASNLAGDVIKGALSPGAGNILASPAVVAGILGSLGDQRTSPAADPEAAAAPPSPPAAMLTEEDIASSGSQLQPGTSAASSPTSAVSLIFAGAATLTAGCFMI